MITKERLEELIKQGAMIYYIRNYTVQQINLSENEFCNYNIEHFYLAMNSRIPYMTVDTWDIKCLYENREQAEWALKTVAERTERFEPPMWDDIKCNYEFAFVKSEDNNLWNNLWKFNVFIGKEKDTGIITITDIKGSIFTEHATKENYEKACEIVRDLFKGEQQ